MKKIIIIFIAVFTVLNIGVTAFANNVPVEFFYTYGDVDFLFPTENSEIEILSERLLYKLHDFEDMEMYADVTADYEMHNTSDESVSVMVAFISNNSERTPEIFFKGELVEIMGTDWLKGNSAYEFYDIEPWEYFEVWESTFKEILFYFNTGESLDNDVFVPHHNYQRLEITLFEITFEPNEICILNVSYTEKAAYSYWNEDGYHIGQCFEFFYLLQPAQYWKDFNNLTITVELPRELNIEFTLDGFKYDDENYIYTAHFDKLPDKNLEIIIMSINPNKSIEAVTFNEANPDTNPPILIMAFAALLILIFTYIIARNIIIAVIKTFKGK